MSKAYAQGTQATYRSHRAAYLKFCHNMGYTPVPATPDTIVRYAAFLARSIKYNSVRQYLNIIRLMHLEWGIANPLAKDFQLQCTLRGIRRTLGDTVNKKLPITPDILLVILSQLDTTTTVDANVWAVCLTLFFGFLRKASVLPPTPKHVKPHSHLSRQDIVFSDLGITITVRHTKTIQFQERTLTIHR